MRVSSYEEFKGAENSSQTLVGEPSTRNAGTGSVRWDVSTIQ
jgi:hypothetical protein